MMAVIDDPLTGYVRAIAICVFRHEGRILVGDGYDPTKQERFYRPPGGRIEFGEHSEVALRREIKEELSTDVRNPKLLGVLENLFTFDGRQGHEIVFVYDGELVDEALYTLERFKGRESDCHSFDAVWLELNSIGSETPPVYPDGLLELLENGQQDGAAVRSRDG